MMAAVAIIMVMVFASAVIMVMVFTSAVVMVVVFTSAIIMVMVLASAIVMIVFASTVVMVVVLASTIVFVYIAIDELLLVVHKLGNPIAVIFVGIAIVGSKVGLHIYLQNLCHALRIEFHGVGHGRHQDTFACVYWHYGFKTLHRHQALDAEIDNKRFQL